jgi:AcrR family transcriptional regulator
MTRPPDQGLARPADQRPAEPRPADQRPAEQLRADARQNHARLITAATETFAEKGADAPLEEIARRAGVGIGTLYRHFPNRLDLQAAVFRTQVRAVCDQGEALTKTDSPGPAFASWARALAAYLVTKRGLSRTLIDAVGADSELITSCWTIMNETTERLLVNAQRARVIRPDVTALDVMRLIHGVAVSSEKDRERTDHLLSITLDGLAAKPE